MSIETKRPVYDTYQQFIEELPGLEPLLSEEDQESKPDIGKDDQDDTYVKRGAFALKLATSPVEIRGATDEKVLGQGEEYVSLHLRKLSEEDANIGYVRQSLAEVAEELALPEYQDVQTIAGLTYARMARTAIAFGFKQSDLPIIQDPSENPDARPVIVHTARTDFVDKHTNY